MTICDPVRKCVVCGQPLRGSFARSMYHERCYKLMYEFYKVESKRLCRRARQIAIIKAASVIKEQLFFEAVDGEWPFEKEIKKEK